MTKIIFLLPPSEGKNNENKFHLEQLSFKFEKPKYIASCVTEKDLKCKGSRFLEGLDLNKNIEKSETLEVINRYTGVMYNSIDYYGMNDIGKNFFENHFFILSGMYGLLKPFDKIGNYKLPIETKGLYEFWGDKILEELNNLDIYFVVNLLPISYSKLIFGNTKKQESIFNKKRKFKIININFLKNDENKISHGVKKIKGEWIKNICETGETDYNNFGGEILEKGDYIDINIKSELN